MTPLIRSFQGLATIEGAHLSPAASEDLEEAQLSWPPVLRSVAAEFIAKGTASGVKIWQGAWGQKVPLLGSPSTSIQGIKVRGRVEGLIKLLVEKQPSRLEAGEELVYVDLVEAAPWNVQRYMNVLGRDPVYKDVGLELIRIAIRESVQRGFDGRVGLHSIPRAVGFYRAIGMDDLGPDSAKGNMPYFEFRKDTAKKLFGDRQ